MGVEAARCLLERIADAQAPAREIVVATELVVRGSTAAPPAALP
jgi:DNA-binding LacI/PurR family transcriptional regulator